MLDFLRKILPKTDTPAPSAAGLNGFHYSGGPVFGSWDPSIHAAPGQLARFGRAVSRPLSRSSKGGACMKIQNFDGPGGVALVQDRSDLSYSVSLDRCTCPDFQERGLPCKHIYALAAFLGYTPADYWASWLDVACADGVIPRPASGYSNGVFRYDVRGVNPETGRKNKRTVSARGEEDAVAAAHEIGLADPVEVLPLDMSAQNVRPVDERQIEYARGHRCQPLFLPDFDEKDAAAVLYRYEYKDFSGVPVGLLQFASKKRLRVSLLSSAGDLVFLFSQKLQSRDMLALYAASVRLRDAGSSLADASQDPVDPVCYAFADSPSGSSLWGEIPSRERERPDDNSTAYRAVLSFLRSHAG